MTLNVRAIKDLVREHNLGISAHRMGQHFLLDSRILERIARTVGAGPGDRLLEIGAGLGALTEFLIATGAEVTAVERDARFSKVLAARFPSAPNLKILHSDILKVDLAERAAGPRSLFVAGNIPYSITSLILEYLLRERASLRRVVLTMQKEVAQRIIAKPGSKEYSSITLLVQIAFKPTIEFQVHPNAFYPQPKVVSAVLKLEPLAEPPVPAEEEEPVLKLVRLLFTHRRKTLLNALSIPGVGLEREEITRRLQNAKIDPVRRPETFSLQELLGLRRALDVNRS